MSRLLLVSMLAAPACLDPAASHQIDDARLACDSDRADVWVDGGAAELHHLSLAGASSQRLFVLVAHTVGGSLESVSAPPRELVWAPAGHDAEPTQKTMTDGRVGEIVGELAGSFGDDDDYVRGCFHAFVGERRIQPL